MACPWLFPQYFTATWDWLQFVSEDFVRHSLQLLAVDAPKPEVLLELPLARKVQTHESRDLALLTLADADAWKQAEESLGLHALTLQQTPAQRGDALLFSGHRQLEEGLQLPKGVDGHFVGRSSSGQEFAWSRELLEEGMCGGAVIDAAGDECVGIVEGIVPSIGQGTTSRRYTTERPTRPGRCGRRWRATWPSSRRLKSAGSLTTRTRAICCSRAWGCLCICE